MALQFTESHLEDSIALLRYYKGLAERAMEQVGEEELFTALDEESNSIGLLVKHMVGNMHSRWTDFLTTDGEKPTRNRDSEFIDPPATREALMKLWEDGWNCVFEALQALSDQDLGRAVRIRGEALSVTQAINRQMAHYAYHVGQMVLLAKHFAKDRWRSLTIPKNGSADFNRAFASNELSQR